MGTKHQSRALASQLACGRAPATHVTSLTAKLNPWLLVGFARMLAARPAVSHTSDSQLHQGNSFTTVVSHTLDSQFH